MERVQSIALWQSYAVQLAQMKAREADRADVNPAHAIKPDSCERRWMWHGTRAEVAGKIVAQGFNRSFAGHNAVMYGRGNCALPGLDPLSLDLWVQGIACLHPPCRSPAGPI